MHPVSSLAVTRRNRALASFTLIELLLVISVIVLLAAITIAAAVGVQGAASRSRARANIAALATALESYKADQGTYPVSTGLMTNNYASQDGTQAGGAYQVSSQLLYAALAGRTNYAQTNTAGATDYLNNSFQVGSSLSPGSGATYFQDPWGYPFAYFTGDGTNNYPYAGNRFYDLWSTAGWTTTTKNPTNINPTNFWITSWK